MSVSSNMFLDHARTPTWDDPDCKTDEKFEQYIEAAFPGKVWTFCSRYLSQTDEEDRLMRTMHGALVRQPVREAEGALFDDDNKKRGAIIIRSQMGTGKTTTLRTLMKNVDEAEKAIGRPLRVLCISSRVSFANTLLEVLSNSGFVMYNMLPDGSFICDANRLIISMESMHKLQDPYRQKRMALPDLVIWDEFTSGAIHVKSPTILEKGVFLDFIRVCASSGHTQFLYMDAFYDEDGLEIIKFLHPNTKIGFLWNVKRPARRGIFNFHYSIDNYDDQITHAIETSKDEWAKEMNAAELEERDPVFNNQLVFCFMSKEKLTRKVKELEREYPFLFAPRYICRIHSDCDAEASRTTLSATTHWPRFIAIFYTSSVLVGTNYDIERRADVLRATRLATSTSDASSAKRTILDKVRVDIFCNADSEHPCAISLAQMMARTRYAGVNGRIHFLLPRNHPDIERYPIDMPTLHEHLDRTRCYMSDPCISRDSGCVNATTIVDDTTGEMFVAHSLEHNHVFVRFYVYAKLCANRSTVSFVTHLKSILDGFSESVFNSTVEQLAPFFFNASEGMQKMIENANMASKKKRQHDDIDAESYAAAIAKMVARMNDGQLNFTADVMRFFDMSDNTIKAKRTMNDELVYNILRFLLYFGLNDLPDRSDEPSMRVLHHLITEIHPWFVKYHKVYENARVPSDKQSERLLADVLKGKVTDVNAAIDRFQSLLVTLSLESIFPAFTSRCDDGISINIPVTDEGLGEVSYHTATLVDFEAIPVIHCCLTAGATYDIIFGDMKDTPAKMDPRKSLRSKQIYVPKLVNFILTIMGFDYTATRSKIPHAAAVEMGIPRSRLRATTDNRVAGTRYTMGRQAYDIAALYLHKEVSTQLNTWRSFDRHANVMYFQLTKHAAIARYSPLFTLPMVEPRDTPLPPVEALGFIGDITPLSTMPSPGCTDFYISRNPEFPLAPVVMPFEEDYSGVEQHDPESALSQLSESPTVSPARPLNNGHAGAFLRFFRSLPKK